jgi:hypothetical protein
MSACARPSARRKAAIVRGFFAAKSAVTATPPIGMPAVAPDHYEVRMIDLVSGRKTDVGGRPKEIAETEQMQGSVRNSVYSPNHEMLFTLYSEYGDEGHAFIHALNLPRCNDRSRYRAGF